MSTIAVGVPPAWCEPYIGIPFRNRGRDRNGLDCFGLVRLVYAEVFGIDLPSYVGRYETTKDRALIARLFFEEATSVRWRRIPLEVAEPPDIVTFTVAGASHVGVLVTAGQFLHVLSGRETCIERLHPHWINRREGTYHHEGVR